MSKRAITDVRCAGLLYPEGTELPDDHKAVRRFPAGFESVAAKKAPAKKKAADKKA